MSEAEQFWKSRARRVAWKQNIASWLTVFLPVFLGAAIVGSCAILILRRQEQPLVPVIWITLAVLLTGALIGLKLQWKKFWSAVDGMVRLEISMRLHNGLTAARAGISAWPQPRENLTDALDWRWRKVTWPILAGIALWLAANLVPVPGLTRTVARPQEQPPAWAEVQTTIDALKKEDVVEPASLENVQDQLDTLRGQDAKEWYDHASLEAGDNLRAETDQAIRDLQKSLQVSADTAAKLMQAGDTPLTDNDLKAMNQALAGALQNLENGKLAINKDLLKKLQKMDPKSLKSLSPEQLAQLQQQLQKGAGACQSCLAPGQGGKKADSVFAGMEKPGQSGGPGGGGGPAPLTSKADTVNLHTKETDTISNDDLTRALPGDVVGLSSGEHQVDKNQTAPVTTAGPISSNGEGGQAVWKDNLTPAERATLGRYFK
ncbi:MAG: hypothetical protein ABIT76_12680 [Chthoniobacterales bacterium]